MKHKLMYIILVLVIIALTLPGCSSGGKATDFTDMLNMVPYSLFQQYDIFFGDFARSRAIHNIENISSFAEFNQASKEDKGKFGAAWNEVPNVVPTGLTGQEFIDLTGFDIFTYNRIILINNVPPRLTFIITATFDKDLLISKLTGMGYQKTDYGKYGYYGIRGDYETGVNDPIGGMVGLSGWNRVAVLDGMIIVSPAAEFVTAILDTMEKKTPSVMENAVCKALVEKLGRPMAASLTTPERIIGNVQMDDQAKFDFTVPEDWGSLKGYDMAALGYRPDNDKRYFDIVLHYQDKAAAEADGQIISRRMNSYSFTYLLKSNGPFTDFFKPGIPVYDASGKDTILLFSNEVIKTQNMLIHLTIAGNQMPIRDLLFLSLNPEKYTGE